MQDNKKDFFIVIISIRFFYKGTNYYLKPIPFDSFFFSKIGGFYCSASCASLNEQRKDRNNKGLPHGKPYVFMIGTIVIFSNPQQPKSPIHQCC